MPAADRNYRPGPIAARGSFTGEFGLGDGLPLNEAPYVIERDRINEGVLPGFDRKLLPMRLDPATGERTAGGYYLLDTVEQAKHMFEWYQDEEQGFILDGIPILRRRYFLNPIAHYWEVIGAEDFGDIHQEQKVVRFERWRLRGGDARGQLLEFWPGIRDRARARGLATAWLLYNGAQEDAIGLVTARNRSGRTDPAQPDFDSVETLANEASLGEMFETAGLATRSFDRTSWIYSIWFPYANGGDNKPTLWPNSPPFPGLP